MWKWSGLALLMLLRLGCDPGPAPAEPAAELPAELPAEPAPPQPAAEPAVIPAKAPATDPLAELFTGAPLSELVDAKAYMLDPTARIGVYFGMPRSWRYDDPSYLRLSPVDASAPGRFAVVRLGEPGLGSNNQAELLRRGALPAELAEARWQPWRDGVVGKGRWSAKIARGEASPVIRQHGALATLAAVVDVPDTRAVGFVAAWPKDAPELEATLRDIARHLHRCRVEVGLGCVAE